MKGALVVGLTLAAAARIGAQDVVVESGHRSGALIQEVLARPHVLRAGSGKLEFPRDSTITSSLVVIGRPTYLASKVDGDVIVINADLFLRPGSEISGRAIAIGGTVSLTTLGTVRGGTESIREETYVATPGSNPISLTYHRLVDPIPLVQPAGIYGFLIPSYDRVDGLSLPVGALVTLPGIEIEPSLTYRSRLGAIDPLVEVRTSYERSVRFEGRAGRDTRSNDTWIYSDLVNSVTTFFNGTDTRNYFRSNLAEGRVFFHVERPGTAFEPFVGARFERVSSVTGTGSIFTIKARADIEHTKRPNPPVEPGDMGSLLVGATVFDTSGVVISRARIEVEGGLSTPTGTSHFTQVTFDGRLGFPTFKTQQLKFRAHAVGTLGGTIARSRYAYLGGSGTIPILELMEQGGDQLVYVESRYLLPVEALVLPFVGIPVLTARHIMAAAGVGALPSLVQDIGVGIGLSALHFDIDTDVNRKRGTKFGVGISLGP